MPFGTDVSSSPALAVDARGDAVIAWTAYGAGGEQVRAAYRLAGRAWQPPRTLSLTGEIADDPRVALDARGRALVVWRASPPSTGSSHLRLEMAARGRTGSWGTAKMICACSANFAFAMNASGQTLVVWSPESGGLWAKIRSATGRWSMRQEISSIGSADFYLPVALNSRGAAVVAWLEQPPGQFGFQLTVAIRPAHGRFGPPQVVGGDAYWGWALGLAPSGDAVLMWADDACCLYAIARSAGARSFGSIQRLDSGVSTTEIWGPISMGARGDALAVWTRLN
jgi:hypothetical protein